MAVTDVKGGNRTGGAREARIDQLEGRAFWRHSSTVGDTLFADVMEIRSLCHGVRVTQ